MNMSSLLSAEISATCNALGYLDEKTNKYNVDSNTLETVKDLIRYLRRDDEEHSIRRQLGQTKILQTDLLPLLKNYHEESDLFDVLLRLIMNLTTPPLLLFNFEIPSDKFLRNLYLEMEDHLKLYKEAFVDDGIWAVFSTHLSKILEIDHAERGDENSVKIERILVLIRNVLFVPSDVMEKRPDNDASIHDQVLWALNHSGLLDIILYITTNPAEQSYYMYILEIMFFMLRDQQPHNLANAALDRSQSEKIRDEAELVAIRNLEMNQKQHKIKKYNGTRHSRFGGTFVVKSMKSISDLELITHKPLNKLDSFNFDTGKRKKKTPKNRSPLMNNAVERRSAFTIRLFLKQFCIEFLNGAYNNMMRYVKSLLVRSGGDVHDESYYFWAINFYMAFNRCYKFEIKLVSETLSVQTFHYVQQQSENYFDLMRTDRKKLLIWSRRLHMALLSYKELFSTLLAMDRSSDEIERQSSKVIKSNIFYVPEYREFILTLLKDFDELKVTDLYLKDLMETQHLFLKMFESFCKGEGSIVVQKKLKKKKKKKSQVRIQEKEMENINSLWDKASPQLSAVLESGGDFLTEEVPFDAASDIPIDEQKSNAMKKIQNKLRQSEFESAISIMRASREVWPENNYFGSANMSSEEEFLALREIFLTDFGNEQVQSIANLDDEEDEEDDEENEPQTSAEVSFDFKQFLERLCHPKIVRACGIALRSFETNSVNTNHAILKLMHRIAFDCKMYVMMFQVSLFRTFQKIFGMKDFPQYKEFVKFCIFIMRQFFKVAQNNDKIFIECLFWSTKIEVFEIENGYGTESKKVATLWSDEEENELYTLFKEYNDTNIEEDIVDWIIKNLVNTTRSRRMVLKKLREMDLDYKSKVKSSSIKFVQNWSTEEEMQLTELYQQYKNSSDPISFILNGLNRKRSKYKVIEKMVTLGLIHDKKEMHKKRQSKHNQEHFQPSQKKRISTVNTNKTEIIQLIAKNLNAGRQDGLEWLQENLSDAIEDFEENISIPLVTLSEDIEMYLDNLEFQRLLKAFGLSEPLNEQERYWRIPEGIDLETLKNNFDLLTTYLNNENISEMDNNSMVNNIDNKNNQKIASKKEITQLIIKNLKAGRQDGLEWLKENFSDAIEDFEENISIPLVTLSEDIEMYLDNLEFQRLLKGFGLSEPLNEQERYWRIPEGIDLETLKNNFDLLTTYLNNENIPEMDNNSMVNNIDNKNTQKIASKNEITQLIIKNLKADRRDGLEWLKENFSDAIEDFEENISIPLVTFSNNIESYTDNLEFQALLKAFGISGPKDEQERYWRIPEDTGLDNLKNNYKLLESCLEDKVVSNSNENLSDTEEFQNTPDIINDDESETDKDNLNYTVKRNRILSNSQSPPHKRCRIDDNEVED